MDQLIDENFEILNAVCYKFFELKFLIGKHVKE